jgi:putative ABC transport system permease protein
LLYFRLFTEIDDNRRYYLQLEKVGVSDRELKKLTWHQSLILFFTPFIAGLIHSTFAMQALGTLLNRTVLQFGWAVALGYLVLYGAFYLVMYAIYWRSLRVTRLAEI